MKQVLGFDIKKVSVLYMCVCVLLMNDFEYLFLNNAYLFAEWFILILALSG